MNQSAGKFLEAISNLQHFKSYYRVYRNAIMFVKHIL